MLALGAVIINAAGKGYRTRYVPYQPAPDTTGTDSTKTDTARKLKFPLYDETGDPFTDQNRPKSIDLADPPNVHRSFDYEVDSNRYQYTPKIGNDFLRNPSYLTLDEYLKYQAKEEEQSYFQRRMDALSLFNKAPELPQMYKEGLFDRIFGSNSIQVKPQGNVDVTFGGNWQNIKNPTLTQRAQKYGVFDFDMQMNINLLATVGDKLKLNISNNTKATFDYQNVQKLDYSGKEDEMLKKIEAGNVSFPLKSNLISGVQSLFGLKTQLQFGKLWVTAVVSQQKSQRKSLTIQGGSQSQQIAIKAYNYEENKNFLLAQYFHDNYDKALADFPRLNSLVTINRIEVWVTNKTGAVSGVRKVMCFMDLGEANPYSKKLTNPSNPVRGGLPDNNANYLYQELTQNPAARLQSSSINTVVQAPIALTQGQDFEPVTARQLSTTEFTFNAQLGYLMLNTQLQPDDVLGVAFRYTYRGRVYQVGEFAADLPPDSTNQKVIFLKLLKGTAPRTTLPTWQLMMKNIYALGGFGVSKENFTLNILYQDPGGGEKRYMPEGPKEGTPFLTLLNLDRLNSQNEPQPDGVFDFVEGITINTQQGKIIFPVLEPFGTGLNDAVANNPVLQRRYQYQVLYDSTKTIAQQYQNNDRYIMRGSYKSSSSSEIFLGGFNIPQGSVTVTAGGTRLVENQDYQIEYGLGRLKILNTGILASGVPINIQYEDNATFGFQQQNFMATRFDYYLNKNLTLGATFMRLKERPFTQKVSFGDDPIQNTVFGLDANYQKEEPAITRLVDKLPIYSTTAPSFLNSNLEVAGLLPGHPKQINALDPEGSVYIDDFEGTSSTYDLKFPAISWSLSSTPRGATTAQGQSLFPESNLNDDLRNGINRARLAWYTIEPTLVDPGGGVPDYVREDSNQHYIRMVQQNDVFPNMTSLAFQSALSTFDLGYYPHDRGPYNFDATNVDPVTGKLLNPQGRWGGITRPIDNTDFESSNVQYIQFWVMDPFINPSTNPNGGSLYINLGNVSEDVVRDSRMFFENGIPSPYDATKLDTTAWGYVPRFEQQITRAFDNDVTARTAQDVGYDGLADVSTVSGQLSEHTKFAPFLNQLGQKLGTNSPAFATVDADPSSDNFRFYRDTAYSGPGSDKISVLTRYKAYNNPQGNSPVTSPTAAYASSATTIPESEDINRDNTLNEAEAYYQYRIDMAPNMAVGTNHIINIQTSSVKLPNGQTASEKWYQFKVPIQDFDSRVGGVSDFRSIRFMRMFMTGWQDSVILRFGTLELGRNQWRTYKYSLTTPGENTPQANSSLTDFTVTSVSIEQNNSRTPVPYVIPPGVARQQTSSPTTTGATVLLNEQSLSLKACSLQDGDARGVYKEVNVDMRQYTALRMFLHAESVVGQPAVNDADVDAFIRIGSDFTDNYYEYRKPLTMTPLNVSVNAVDQIWPLTNEINIDLGELVQAKKNRDAAGWPTYVPYYTTDSKGNTIVIIGTPNIGGAKDIMLGLLNPKKSNSNPSDDGQPKCLEVWFDELRMAGLNDQAGYAAAGKASIQVADLGNVNVSGSMHTQGYGNIDQKIQQRSQDDYYQYNTSTNLNLGKLMPRSWGVQMPAYVGYTENVSTPKYNPYDQDILLKDALAAMKTTRQRDSLMQAAQDFTSIMSFNFTNVRFMGNPAKAKKNRAPWSLKNFDFTYSYNNQFKHNPIIDLDLLNTQRLGVGYSYSLKTKAFEPFKNRIKSKSKWLSPIRDFNFTPLPSTFTMRNDLNRVVEETRARTFDDASTYQLQSTFYKNFTWTRLYTLRWELTRSLSFDYTATNISRIDEPYGRIDTKEKRDSLLRRIESFGHNTSYAQTFNSSYNVPLSKLPLTDWMNLRLNYAANYSWLTAPPAAYTLGNTIGNTQTRTATGDLNFVQLYNKSRWLKAITSPPSQKKPAADASHPDLRPGAPGQGPNKGPLGKNGKPGTEAANNPDKGTTPGAETSAAPAPEQPKKTREQTLMETFPGLDISKLSDEQLDSLVDLQKELDKKKRKEDKKKRKAAKKAARKLRRQQIPELSPGVRAIGQVLTMVSRITVNYTQTGGTILPGYMDSTRFMGVNNYTGAPGFDFVYGYQPDYTWLAAQAAAGRLTHDSLFNSQFQQTYSRNISATAALQPQKDLRIDLTLTQTFSKSHSELYADTGTGQYNHFNPYETGAFSITTINLGTMLKNTGVNSTVYNNFLNGRTVISRRLGASNPYTNGLPDPLNPGYSKGYGPYSQDVLIPSFLAAYSGQSPESAALLDYTHTNISDNPFKYFLPMPNWRLTYNGLSKLPFFQSIFNSFVLNHGYTGTTSMNSFNSSLIYQDLYGLGFPSFIDSNSHNYTPYFQVPNVTITQALNPLIGIDASFKNHLTAKFEVRKSKTESLSLIDYQVAENLSTEYVIGIGFRKKGIRLPFEVFGVRKLKNELIVKADIGLRDEISNNTFLANNISVTSRGQKVLRISPTIDYSVNQRLTLRFFYDRQQTIPYVSNSYPTTTTRGGLTLRFIFAQ